MNWKNHIIVGFILSILFIVVTINFFEWDVKLLFTSIPIIVYYSILPDIDHRISKMTGVMMTSATIFIVVGYLSENVIFFNNYFNSNMLPFGIIILIITLFCSSKYVSHRGITHTLQIAILSPFLLVGIFGLDYYYMPLYVVAFVSYWSHLLTDGCGFKIKLKKK